MKRPEQPKGDFLTNYLFPPEEYKKEHTKGELEPIGIPEYLHASLGGISISLLKSIYSQIKICKHVGADENKLGVKDDVLVNEIINRYYYDQEIVDRINRGALKYCKSLIGISDSADESFNETISDLKGRFYSYQVQKDIEYFIRPILLNHIFLLPSIRSTKEFEMAKTDNEEFNGIGWFYESPKSANVKIKAFMRFYDNEFMPLKNKTSKRIGKLQMLLNKYIENKHVKLTPAGIVVTKSNVTERQRSNLKDYKFDNTIGIDLLSSGEIKLLLIFMICIFVENIRIIIDEPEISLSIIWQERLLPDLIKETDASIIVATHSPAIIRDEHIEQYITALPMDVNI